MGATPPVQYDPAVHAWHVVSLAAPVAREKKPAEQGVGAVRPEEAQYSSIGHVRQVDREVAERVGE
jgi:hypothetical protein